MQPTFRNEKVFGDRPEPNLLLVPKHQTKTFKPVLSKDYN